MLDSELTLFITTYVQLTAILIDDKLSEITEFNVHRAEWIIDVQFVTL